MIDAPAHNMSASGGLIIKGVAVVNPTPSQKPVTVYEFDLFIAGRTFFSEQFLRKFHKHARRFLQRQYRLNVIDVLIDPGEAERNLVLATPTLIKRTPSPAVRLVGVPADWEEFFVNMQSGSLLDDPHDSWSRTPADTEETTSVSLSQQANEESVETTYDHTTKAVSELNSAAGLSNLIAAIADGVLVLDAGGRILYANPAAEHLLGRPSHELTGLLFGKPVVRDDKLEIDLLGARAPFPVAELNITRTEWDGAPAYVATMRDITSHKSATELATERVHVRDNFLATLSHEMRNPLAAISNAAQIVSRSESLGGVMLEQVAAVLLRQCTQMSRLLDDLLEVSRISQGKIEIQRRNVRVRTLINDAAQVVAPLMDSRRIQFHVEPCDPEIVIKADPVRLQQALGNLLTNAVKYTEPGGAVWLSTHENHGHVEITVRDNGTGIPPELAARMFEPFVQGEHNSNAADGGLGIGLALVRTLVELHDGEVWARSEGAGKGSEFTIDLPLSSGNAEIKENPPEAGAGESLSIVLVEDNPDVRNMLKRLLEMDQHRVTIAENGQEGLETILSVKPDIALVDLGLPLLDGREVAAQVRESPGADDVFLVALTGFGNADDRRSTRAAGFDAHLTKPVNIAKLNSLLKSRVAFRESTA